jgi:hypothetical protein
MPLGVDGHRAFDASFSAINRASARFLTPAGGFRDAAVYRHLLELQTDDPIVGFSDYPLQRIHRPGLYPLVASAAQGGGGASLVSDPPVRAAEDEHLHKLLEDHLVGDTSAVAAERMIRSSRSGNRAQNCSQMGSMMYGGTAGMETLLRIGELRELPE